KGQSKPFVDRDFLCQCQVHLPDVWGPNQAAPGISKSQKISLGIGGWRLKGQWIDPIVRGLALGNNRNSRHNVRTLVACPVTIRNKGRVGTEEHSEWMSSVPHGNSAEVPSSEQFAREAAVIEISPSRAKRQLVH